jgi:WD40 repeat protein
LKEPILFLLFSKSLKSLIFLNIMAKVVRNSKFRHLFGTAAQLRECYGDIRIGQCSFESNVLKANNEFFALPWATPGSVLVSPLERKGAVSEEAPLIIDEEEPDVINELNFCPTNSHLLATAHQKGAAKIWKIPEGGLTTNMSQAAVVFNASQKRLLFVDFHPLVSDVIVTAGADFEVKVWDANSPGAEKATLPKSHKGIVTSVTWNGDGSLMATSSKDKNLRVFDPRSSSLVAEVPDHQGAKSGRALWLGKQDKIVTCGFTKTSDREFSVYDPRNIKAKLASVKIDNSTSTPLLFSDEDLDLIYLSGRGDGNIRYYEFTNDAPVIHTLSEFKSKEPAAGMAQLPKTSCNIMACEVDRFLKLTPQGQIIPIRFEVPRQNQAFFQDDLFPDTWDYKPASTSSEWFDGVNRKPNTRSLKP